MTTRRVAGRYSLYALLAAGGAAAAHAAWRRFLAHPLPQLDGQLKLPGLQKAVEVLRDEWGVPHIYAQTEVDLFFAQGFVHAQDRFFQMDINRRLGLGRLSEVVGPAGLASDRLARICGWHVVAETQAQALAQHEETAALVEAYTAGVNAYLQHNPLPVEFSLLAYRPEPWRPVDCTAWGAVLAWGLSVNWETETLRAMLISELGPQRAADLIPAYESDYPTVLPQQQLRGRLAAALQEAYQEFAGRLTLEELPQSGSSGGGSNNWVLSGARTASGRPILANDPHLPPLSPAIWYENHLHGGRFNVTGFTTPGVPGVVIGHNERCAWGVTNAFADEQDLYVERFHPEDPLLYEVNGSWQPAEVRREEIRVRGRRRPVVEEVRYTRHGPVISALFPTAGLDLALRWAAHDGQNHLHTVLEMNQAHDWESFCQALHHWAFPSQNVVYADVEGNIGYVMAGRVPVRGRGAGLLPAPGHEDSHEWQGWLSFEELPQCYNPAEGFITSANNCVAGDDFPQLLTGEWLPPYRAQRIRELLAREEVHTIENCARIQNDTVSLQARRFLAVALPLLAEAHNEPHPVLDQAYFLLQQWGRPAANIDGHDMQPQRVAPAIYRSWIIAFTHAVMTQALGPELKERLLAPPGEIELAGKPFHSKAVELAINWLERDAPKWVGDVRPLLYRTFRQGVVALQREYGPNPAGWQWGRLHQLEIRHPLSLAPVLGRLWKTLRYPLGGDAHTVNQARSTPHMPLRPVQVIASCRLVLDVGEWDNSITSLPGGQSGHPASEHYQDGVVHWLQGEYHPALFSRPRVEQATKHKLLLEPASQE